MDVSRYQLRLIKNYIQRFGLFSAHPPFLFAFEVFFSVFELFLASVFRQKVDFVLQELDFLFEPLPDGFELLLLLRSDLLGHDLEIDVLLFLRFRDLLFLDRNRSIRTQIFDHRLMTGIKLLVYKLGKDNSGCKGIIPNYKDCTFR